MRLVIFSYEASSEIKFFISVVAMQPAARVVNNKLVSGDNIHHCQGLFSSINQRRMAAAAAAATSNIPETKDEFH
jgi:hypothetical protein